MGSNSPRIIDALGPAQDADPVSLRELARAAFLQYARHRLRVRVTGPLKGFSLEDQVCAVGHRFDRSAGIRRALDGRLDPQAVAYLLEAVADAYALRIRSEYSFYRQRRGRPLPPAACWPQRTSGCLSSTVREPGFGCSQLSAVSSSTIP